MSPVGLVSRNRTLAAYVVIVVVIVGVCFGVIYRREQNADAAIRRANHVAHVAQIQEHRSRRFAVRVCRSVNLNGRNLTIEHRRTRKFLLIAYRIRAAAARSASTRRSRHLNAVAAHEYHQLAESYKPFRTIPCRIP